VSGVAPTHSGDGAQLRKPEAAIETEAALIACPLRQTAESRLAA
jgi:hypothetical protein